MKSRFGSSFYMFGADYVWPQKMFATASTLIESMGGTVAGTEFTPWGVKEFAPVVRRIKESGAKVLVFALPGADGMNMGTRFLATVEAPVHQNVKDAILAASELDTRQIGRASCRERVCTYV